jgi:NTE family protein
VEEDEPEGVLERFLKTPRPIRGPISMLAAMFTTMMEAHDKLYIQDKNFARTIPIPTRGVGFVDFDLDSDQAEALYESGRQAAKEFFDRWDFALWKNTYRAKKAPGRRERLVGSKQG